MSEQQKWKRIVEDKVIIKHGDMGFMILLNFCDKVWMRSSVLPVSTSFTPIMGLDRFNNELEMQNLEKGDEEEFSEKNSEISIENSSFENSARNSIEKISGRNSSIENSADENCSIENSIEKNSRENSASNSVEREETIPSVSKISEMQPQDSMDIESISNLQYKTPKNINFTPEKKSPYKKISKNQKKISCLISPRSLLSASKKSSESTPQSNPRTEAKKGKKNRGKKSKKIVKKLSQNFGNNRLYNHNNVLLGLSLEEVHENLSKNNTPKKSLGKEGEAEVEVNLTCCICHSKNFVFF